MGFPVYIPAGKARSHIRQVTTCAPEAPPSPRSLKLTFHRHTAWRHEIGLGQLGLLGGELRSMTAPGPVIPRRRIAKELRTLREQAHLRLDEVARKTEVSTSTLSRLENAQGTANALTIRALVDFYKIAGTELGKNLIGWARDGRKPGWWQGYPGAAVETNPSYVAYEAQASTIRLYLIPFIATLFQTHEYAEALAMHLNPESSKTEISDLVDFRQRRQQNLRNRDNQSPLEVHAILHYSCMTQMVGSPAIMRTQLNELLSIANELKDTVTIQILPQSARPHRATTCMWSHFHYAPDLDGVVFIETHMGLIPHEDQDQVDRAKQDFEELAKISLSPRNTLKFIKESRDTYYS